MSADMVQHREVVRIRTTAWKDKNGCYLKKSMTFQRRKSIGHGVLEDDCDMIGSDEVIPRITNLAQCEDGLYEVLLCNESKDWETGTIDSWDYKLVPHKP